MKKPSILSLGEVLWDHFPGGSQFGGAPANFACHVAALGAEATLLSAVGDDAPGAKAIAILQQQGVGTSLLQRTSLAPTGAVDVSVDPAGKPAYVIREPAAWDHVMWRPDTAAHVRRCTAVYFGTLGQRSAVSRASIRQALRCARRSAIPRILDVNLRPPFLDDALIQESLALATVVKLSDDEVDRVARACAIAAKGHPENILHTLLARFGLDMVAMTRGPEGALLVTRAETVDQPGIRVVVRDTVGAGDAFTAALAVGLQRGEPLTTIARVACQTAAMTCTHSGAVQRCAVRFSPPETPQ